MKHYSEAMLYELFAYVSLKRRLNRGDKNIPAMQFPLIFVKSVLHLQIPLMHVELPSVHAVSLEQVPSGEPSIKK